MDIFWKRDQSDMFYCISTICWKSSKETIGDGDSIDDSSSWNILYELALFHWEGKRIDIRYFGFEKRFFHSTLTL